MSRILTLLLLAFCLLHSSCTRWHTADRLRDPYTTYTGVDIYHPVDGKIYHLPEDEPYPQHYYVIAPEVSYQRRTHLTNTDGFYPVCDTSQNIRPTGRTVVAAFSYSHGFEKILPRLPEGVVSEVAPKENQGGIRPRGSNHWCPEGNAPWESLGAISKQEHKPGFARRLLIGTCDYLVDPLLNIIMVPLDAIVLPFGGWLW